ncbi:MAG: hypothetical protein WC516_07920 [Patescibacteria group bacterium]|jgi:hypothetical protein
MKKKMVAMVERSKLYGKVIKINCPVRFYWTKHGDFDGIDYDISTAYEITAYQKRLLVKSLEVMLEMMDLYNELSRSKSEVTPIPDYIKKAFLDDTESI